VEANGGQATVIEGRWQSGAEPGAPWEDEAVTELLTVSTMTLATSNLTGAPHAAPVFFAHVSGLRLVFFSDPASLHVRHLTENPRAAAGIYPVVADWTRIHGLQLTGTVRPIPPGAEWDEAWVEYREKFPFVADLGEIVDRNWLYVLEPSWVRLVDNRRGFGYRREWTGGDGTFAPG
jgi:uncharacterized protein